MRLDVTVGICRRADHYGAEGLTLGDSESGYKMVAVKVQEAHYETETNSPLAELKTLTET